MMTMGLTLTEKILRAHLVDGEPVKGQEIGIRIDLMYRSLMLDTFTVWSL